MLHKILGLHSPSHMYEFGWLHGVEIGPNKILSAHQLLAKTDAHKLLLHKMPACSFTSHLWWFGWLYWAKLLENQPQCYEMWPTRACKNWYKHNMPNTCHIFILCHILISLHDPMAPVPSLESWSHSDEIWTPRACKNWFKQSMLNNLPELHFPSHLH